MKDAAPHQVIFHPLVTEKTMSHMTERNSLEFLVRREANKTEIRDAVTTMFGSKVSAVRTRITKDGKRAVVAFADDGSAEEIGMRLGVF